MWFNRYRKVFITKPDNLEFFDSWDPDRRKRADLRMCALTQIINKQIIIVIKFFK